MKHRPRPPEQDDLLRPRLVDMIDQRHELVKLAALIDWEVFEREWAGFFPSGTTTTLRGTVPEGDHTGRNGQHDERRGDCRCERGPWRWPVRWPVRRSR